MIDNELAAEHRLAALQQYREECQRLTGEAARLAKDAKRLDFVLQKQAFIVWCNRDGSIKQCQLMDQNEDEEFFALSGEDRFFNDPRAAIDAAIAASAINPNGD